MSREKSLVFLAYVSRMACGPAEVDDILRVSRANNASADLTGLLIHDQRRFFQVIEGDPVRVGATRLRIADDPRHTDLRLLASRRVDFRLFSNWRMKDAVFEDGRATITSRLGEIEDLALDARVEALQDFAMSFAG